VHGELPHALSQLPFEHGHIAPEHERLWRDALVPGSDTAGPPFGVPGLAVPLDPPHAAASRAITPRHARAVFIKCLLHREDVPQRHAIQATWWKIVGAMAADRAAGTTLDDMALWGSRERR
jgi:hypothetical protein